MSDDILPSNVPPEDEDLKVLELLKLAKTNPHIKGALIKSIVGSDDAIRKGAIKMLGGFQGRDSAYYNEESALKVKFIIDQMLGNPEAEFEIIFSDYKHRPATIRQKIYDGLSYLIEKMDTPERTYAQWKVSYEIQKIHARGQCIGLRFINVRASPARSLAFKLHKVDMQPEAETTVMEAQNWKDIIIQFMQGFEKSIKLTDLKLNIEDKQWIMNLFTEPGEFVVYVTNNMVSVRRETNWPSDMQRVIIE